MSNTPTIERPPPFPNKKADFGPGQYEDLVLVSWVDRNHTRWVRAKGTYQVYCGYGDHHITSIDIRSTLDDTERTTPWDVIEVLVEWALQDWSDPCDDHELSDSEQAAEDATWD